MLRKKKVQHYIDSIARMEVKQADDEMVPIEEYPDDIDPKTGERMGNPWTNGRGHKVMKWEDGNTYVCVPILQRMRIKRSKILDSLLRKDGGDNSLAVTDDEMQNRQALAMDELGIAKGDWPSHAP